MLLELSAARRLLAICVLCLAIIGLRLIPTPPPARADLCGTFPIGIACGAVNGAGSVLSTVVDVGGGAAKLGVNVTTGAISVGGKVIGKAVSVGGNILCNYVAEGWMKKLGCGPVKSLLSKLAGKAVGAAGAAASGATGGGGSSGTPGTAQVPADSPQSYLRTSAIAAGAAFFAGEIAHVVSRGTSADVTAPWYKQLYGRVSGFAVGVALLALLLALAEGATFGDGALVSAALRAVPYAALMTAAATSLVMLALRVVDAASSGYRRAEHAGGHARPAHGGSVVCWARAGCEGFDGRGGAWWRAGALGDDREAGGVPGGDVRDLRRDRYGGGGG